MTISSDTLILAGTFAYFAFGALVAFGIWAPTQLFTGKFEPLAIVAFFAWPVFYLIRIPGLLLAALVGLTAACGMTWLVYLALQPS